MYQPQPHDTVDKVLLSFQLGSGSQLPLPKFVPICSKSDGKRKTKITKYFLL